jgi:hypothetical protein
VLITAGVGAGIGSLTGKLTTSFVKAFGISALKSLAKVPAGVFTELIEEMYFDPWLENLVSSWVYKIYGTDEKGGADFWSSFVSSFREAFVGGVTGIVGIGIGGSDTNVNINEQVSNIMTDQSLTIEQQSNQIESLSNKINDQLTKLENEKVWQYFINTDTMLGVITSLPSFFFGGANLGILALGLDISMDSIIQRFEDKAKIKEYGAQIDELEKQVYLLKPKPTIDLEGIDSKLFSPVSTKTVPEITIPLSSGREI